MPFCSNCGTELGSGMRFCPGCGQAVAAEPVRTQADTVEYEPIDLSTPIARGDHSVILVSRGTAARAALQELLEDVLGYTAADARRLTNGAVMEVARYLTAEQAMYLAQALTEYGAEAAIATPAGLVNLRPTVRTSVFNSAGYFTAAVTAAFAMLTSLNRVEVFTPWMRGDARRYLFAPLYRPMTPPLHIRRVRQPPTPRPAPARAVRPAAAPRPAKPAAPAAPRAKAPAAKAPAAPNHGGGRKPGGPGGPGPGRR